MKKSRKMIDINTKEISLVNKPANKRSFLLFKQDGKSPDDSLLKAKKKINIEIESDGTVGGTSIAVNGEKVKKLQSFNFSFWEGTDKDAKVSASYSILAEAADGFQRTETYYLAKGDGPMDKRLETLLKDLFGDGFEKAKFEPDELNEATIVELEKALKTVIEYKKEFPTDLGAAVGLLAVHASQGYKQPEPTEKAGAKLSKDTLGKMKALVAAAKALEALLPKEADSEGDSTKKGDEDSSELQKTVEKLAETMAAITSKLEKKEASDEIVKVGDAVAKIADRIKALEKQPASIKKSLEQGNEEPAEKEVTKDANGRVVGQWPSLMGQPADEE